MWTVLSQRFRPQVFSPPMMSISDQACQISASYEENGIASSDTHSISIRDTSADNDSDGDGVPDTQDDCSEHIRILIKLIQMVMGLGMLCESAGSTVLRINAGGGDYVDGGGNLWSADFGYNTGIEASTTDPISATTDDPLYKSERWDSSARPELQYSFDVPNGNYTVNLHFADFAAGTNGVGSRIFDVAIEGELVIDNLDIYREVGHDSALEKSFSVAVTDGQLNIEFLHEIEDPKISAIEIMSQSSTIDIIIDNGGLGTSWTGTWKLSGGENYYGTQAVYSYNDASDTYTFAADIEGYYDLYMWWTWYSNRCSTVVVDIYDDNTLLKTVEIDQQDQTEAARWNYLSTYWFNGNARVVINGQDTLCSICADSVRFVRDVY